MTIASILKEKSANKTELLAQNNLKNKKLPLWLIKLNSDLIDWVLVDALKILPANFIISWKNNNFWDNWNIKFIDNKSMDSGFDFVVCDWCEDSINQYLNSWIVPVISKNHHISSILKEFDAKKIEWNAFIFENNALCDIYYAIIRYMENYKFPYDHKALVKNVLDI